MRCAPASTTCASMSGRSSGRMDDTATRLHPQQRKNCSMSRKTKDCPNLVVISDIHAGSRLGLCPVSVSLDGGGTYVASKAQRVLLSWWEEFWDEFVPRATDGEPFHLIVNGDCVEGSPHGSVAAYSAIMDEHCHGAEELLRPRINRGKCDGYWHIRGTEAHVGKSGEYEERVARNLGAIKGKTGEFARWELWKTVGDHVGHFLHHIGTTGSTAREASAVNGELSALLEESARWGERSPDFLVRSHRHRAIEVRLPGSRGWRFAVVTPAWQLRTPFAFKIPGGRLSTPQIGGMVIRSRKGACYTVPFVKHIERDNPE